MRSKNAQDACCVHPALAKKVPDPCTNTFIAFSAEQKFEYVFIA